MGTQPAAPNIPGLYGISNSNRRGTHLWGKNEFNSTFPAALACYMRDHDVRAVYLSLGQNLQVTATELPINQLFNTTRPNDQLRFEFETRFEPYQQYALDDIGPIDLVIKHDGDAPAEAWRRALEVKLTVMPDSASSRRPETEWSPELVIRPASTKYCALGMFAACRTRRNEIRDIFQEVCGNFQLWNSIHEVRAKRTPLLDALNEFQRTFHASQQPFLIQPIWKTEGKSPSLADQAFDLFVWSDFALCRTFIDKSLEGDEDVSRLMRASARLARVLYVLSTQERANLNGIYTEMAYGAQTDKEYSLPGRATRAYLNSPRRVTPALNKSVVAEIILNGGEKLLSPERRFDATIYFTAHEIFEAREAARLAAVATAEAIAEEE